MVRKVLRVLSAVLFLYIPGFTVITGLALWDVVFIFLFKDTVFGFYLFFESDSPLESLRNLLSGHILTLFN